MVDYGGKVYGILGVAMPLFWGGLVLVYVFYFKFGIAPPPTGRIDMLVSPPKPITGSYLLDSLLTGDGEALLSSAAHLVLPVITLAFVTGASIARMTYTSMRKVLASQFILVSHAYGLSPRAIVYKFALKNALMPVVTLVGLQVGFLVGGVVLVEVVFSLPGIGRYAVESLLVNDFAPVQGFVLLVLVVYLLINLCVDLLYGVLNPQVRHGWGITMATAQSSTQTLRFPALPTRLLRKPVIVKWALAGHTLYRLGVLITLFWVAVALLAPWIAPYSPTQGDAALAKGSPSLSHLFGLDKYGRNIPAPGRLWQPL